MTSSKKLLLTAGSGNGLSLEDHFLGAGDMGDVESTPGVPWQELVGDWSSYAGQPTTPESPSNNPLCVADARTADVAITLDETLGSGGVAVYFRVRDAANWLRARTYYNVYTTTRYRTEYKIVSEYAPSSWNGHTHRYESWQSSYVSPYTDTITHVHTNQGGPQAHSHTKSVSTQGTRSVADGTKTVRQYRTYLDKCVGGTITTVTNAGFRPTQSMTVIAIGSTITIEGDGAQMLTATVTEHQGETLHGFGIATTPDGSPLINHWVLEPMDAPT